MCRAAFEPGTVCFEATLCVSACGLRPTTAAPNPPNPPGSQPAGDSEAEGLVGFSGAVGLERYGMM